MADSFNGSTPTHADVARMFDEQGVKYSDPRAMLAFIRLLIPVLSKLYDSQVLVKPKDGEA